MNNINAIELKLGKGVYIHPTASICGMDGQPADSIEIGDQTYIGERVQIRCNNFKIGDYGKIHHDTNVHGKLVHIGHNFWCGQFCIIDGLGGTQIKNNVGVGAHSQLWSHIKFGDELQGCLYNSVKPLFVDNDVWFVGHCIVSPIHAHEMSMALVGSVITKDMNANEVYGGTPARALNKRQFDSVSFDKKFQIMYYYFNDFTAMEGRNVSDGIMICAERKHIVQGMTCFVVADRKYTKQGTPNEIAFMKYLLPTKAKFVPYED